MAIGDEYANEIIGETRRSIRDGAFEKSVTCTPQPDSHGVGLWQWIVETKDGSVSMKTQHTVCRYGLEAKSPPACPYNACADVDSCSSCEEFWNEDLDEETLSMLNQTLPVPVQEPHPYAKNNCSMYTGS